MAHDVFISYSSKDKPVADAVVAELEIHGIHCWITAVAVDQLVVHLVLTENQVGYPVFCYFTRDSRPGIASSFQIFRLSK